jgi:hypothetical protein
MRHVARLGTEPNRLVDDAEVGEQGAGSEEIGVGKRCEGELGPDREVLEPPDGRRTGRSSVPVLDLSGPPGDRCDRAASTGAVLGTGANPDHKRIVAGHLVPPLLGTEVHRHHDPDPASGNALSLVPFVDGEVHAASSRSFTVAAELRELPISHLV